MPTITEAIQHFLGFAQHNGPDLIARYLAHATHMETQINVVTTRGTPIDGKSNRWTDGTNEWFHLRIPRKAATTPEFQEREMPFRLSEYAEAIGSTGWDWVNRQSRWFGFDFDAIAGHATGVGISAEQLERVREAAQNLDYVEARRSTGGKGLHLYVLADGIPSANHTEHARRAKLVLGKMSADVGFDFAAHVDAVGGNMWLWHRKMTAENRGLALIKPATRALTAVDLPSPTPAKPKTTKPSKQDCHLRWADILEPHGWTPANENSWRRPGATDSHISASVVTAANGDELLHVFTSGAPPLEKDANYNKLSLYAALNHDGDVKAAKKALTPSTADRLTSYPAEVFKTPDGDAYATVEVNGHRETYKIDSKSFRLWLTHRYYCDTKKALGSQALAEAINTYQSRALFEGETHEVHVRLAEHGGNIYLDLGRDDWSAVEISPTGCQIVQSHPVKFRRPRSLLPLAVPDFAGTIDSLRPFLNVSDDDFRMLCFVLASYMQPRGPYPVTLLECAHGSAKSTSLKVLRRTFDNNKSLLRGAPRSDFDLLLAATNSYCVTIDNISSLPEWLADAICRLSTGAGLGTREFYGQDEEKLLDACRPIMFGTITDLTTRADFLSRCVLIRCLPIDDETRRDERKFYREYEAALPKILGALCNAVSTGLRELPNIRLTKLPRMADFALWSSAVETSFFERGTFERLYGANRQETNEMITSSPVAHAVTQFIGKKKIFWGSASELFNELLPHVGAAADMPSNPQVLSRELKRLVGAIPNMKIEIKPKKILIERT